MKYLSMLTVILLLSFSLIACSDNNPKPNKSPESETSSELSSTESSEISKEPETTSSAEPIIVADASHYRGTVSNLIFENDIYTLTLEQYEGTDYGAPSIKVAINQDTKLNFDPSEIKDGDYLEVFYGGSLEAGIDEALVIIGANDLGDSAASRNFNGIIKSINPNPDKEGTGNIVVTDLKGENETIVNYDNNNGTQFYLNFDELAVGDKINIFHAPVVAASLPPQISALEVGPFVE